MRAAFQQQEVARLNVTKEKAFAEGELNQQRLARDEWLGSEGKSHRQPHTQKCPARGSAHPSLFPKAQDHLHRSVTLFSHVGHPLPLVFSPLGLLSRRVPANTHKADVVRELPSP